jgi:hypothetical protein
LQGFNCCALPTFLNQRDETIKTGLFFNPYTFFITDAVAAQQISGRVTDAQSGLGISYTTVGLAKANKGTTALQDGSFKIDAPAIDSFDSLVISSVGYRALKVALENGQTFYNVKLSRKEQTLKVVLIRKYFNKVTLPWFKGDADYSFATIGLNTQVARCLSAPVPSVRLESVSVAMGQMFFSPKRNYRFQLRIYDYDSVSGQPGAELTDSVIEVSGRGMMTIKLKDYGIIIPQKKFFVAVQWLFIEENMEEVISADGKYQNYHFHPAIRMKRTNDTQGSTWIQYHNQQWVRREDEAAITATVSY